MATRPVRFEFHCDSDQKLKFTHHVPRSLVAADANAQQSDPQYMQTFVATLQPIMQEHQAACRAASSAQCSNCGAPAWTVLQTPMSWLHLVDDPFVNVWVNPVCRKPECEGRTRQKIQDMMELMMGEGQGPVSAGAGAARNTVEILPCRVCRKTEATKKCAQCMLVAYCGREHQKADWKVHKRLCAALSRGIDGTV
ncbi:MAG: hypothetical protein M1818_000599 [Claussenomyces sp. TS43310]|nr:MAG: hypothetical protein M1818_000599 [Claussenomyces sp. TS43310]